MPTLRQLTSGQDAMAVARAVFSDPEARRGMGWTEQDDAEEAKRSILGLWRRRFQGDWVLFAIEVDGRDVGLAGLGSGSQADEPPWVAVYLLERGRGLGRRATEQLLDLAAEQGHARVRAVTWAENKRGRGLLEALGFEDQGPASYPWAEESGMAWLVYEHRLAGLPGR